MDNQMMFSLKEVVVLLLAAGGCIGTFWTLMRQIDRAITKADQACNERLTRQSERFERDIKELRSQFYELDKHGLTVGDFKEQMHEFGAQVVGNIKAEVKAEMLEMMQERDNKLIAVMKEIISEKLEVLNLERRK